MARTKKTQAPTQTEETQATTILENELNDAIAAEEQLAEETQGIVVEDVTEEFTALVPVAEGEAESSGDAKATKPFTIDPLMPWAQWSRPDTLNLKLSELEIKADGEALELKSKTSGDRLGAVTTTGLRQLGWNVSPCPAEFIETLSPATRAVVINERIAATAKKDREVVIVLEDGEFTNLMPGWRGVAAYQDVAQTAVNTLRDVYGDVMVDEARRTDGHMHLRLLTEVQKPVTPAKGDILQMGVEVYQDYGQQINLALYVKRLTCLNGMTAAAQEFTWRNRATGTIEHQLSWLRSGLAEVVGAYDQLVARAQQMAETPFNGDPRTVLREHARAMRLPSRYFNALVEAYEAESDAPQTEWALLNAFTRLATHGGVNRGTARQIQLASGDWTQNFEVVSARLPRAMATLVGAHIVE